MIGFLRTLGAPKDIASKGRKKKRYTRFKGKKRAAKLDESAQHTRFQNERIQTRDDAEHPAGAASAPIPPRTVAPPVEPPVAHPMASPIATARVPKNDAAKPPVEPVATRVVDPVTEPAVEPAVEPVSACSTNGVTTPTAADAFFHKEPSPKRSSAAAQTQQPISPNTLRQALPKRFEEQTETPRPGPSKS